MLKVAKIAQDKANEKILKSLIEDGELLKLASRVLHKLMPTHVMDLAGSSSNELKRLIKFVESHFKSFEDLALAKVKNEFKKRVDSVKELIAKDKDLLSTFIENVQGAISEGGKVYKSCLILSKSTKENEKIKYIEQ